MVSNRFANHKWSGDLERSKSTDIAHDKSAIAWVKTDSL